MTQKEKTIWQEYISILERLFKTVQSQTLCLQNKEWEKLKNLFGKKENIHLSLQKIDEEIGLLKENKNDCKVFREKAKKLINKIMSIEKSNKELITESMKEIKSELSKLNSKKRLYKTYLDSSVQQRQAGVNLVS